MTKKYSICVQLFTLSLRSDKIRYEYFFDEKNNIDFALLMIFARTYERYTQKYKLKKKNLLSEIIKNFISIYYLMSKIYNGYD